MAKKKKKKKKGLIIGMESALLLYCWQRPMQVWDIISMTIFIREP